jgi:hypothetical protein
MTYFIHWHPAETALPRLINNEIWNYKRGFSMVMTGSNKWKIRTGKSIAALYLSSLVDKTLTADTVRERVFYKPSDLLRAQDRIDKRHEIGRALIPDESEELISNTAWQSVTNRCVALSVATGGYRRTFMPWVTPTFGYIDKRIRLMLNGWGSTYLTMKSDRKMRSVMRFYLIATNDMGDKIWRAKPEFFDQHEKKLIYCTYYDVTLPQTKEFQEMKDVYEEFSREAKSQINKNQLEIVEQEEENILRASEKDDKDIGLLFDQIKTNEHIERAIATKGKVTDDQVRWVLDKEKKRATIRGVKNLTFELNAYARGLKNGPD